jgi:hypothetical protein
MKRLSRIIKEGVQPGNQLNTTGVTNHYTPIQNILTNIKNLFCLTLGVVAEVADDNVSIKLSSSQFVSRQKTEEILWRAMYNDVFTYGTSSLYGYITSQGLPTVTFINLGGYYVVYFSPNDIKTAEDPRKMALNDMPEAANESLLNEFEIGTFIKEDDSEEEMKSETVSKVLELLDGPDKVKAAKQLELLVSKEIQLPREYYFSAIKFKSGEEAIALRWKYTKKMPFGKAEGDGEYKETTVENTRSLMHIFGKGEKAIWVQDFDEDSLVELPEEVKKLIQSILDLLEAGETDDPSVFSLTGERKERKDDDENKDEDDDNNKDDDKGSKSGDDDDSEDDDSRGDDTL